MRLSLEIFFSKVSDSEAEYLKHSIDLSAEIGDPDKFVQFVLQEKFPELKLEDCIIHSTSWRFEPTEQIILTYIVYSDKVQFSDDTQKLPVSEIEMVGSEDPGQPRPEQISEKAVLFHALRHLSFLVKSDFRFQKNISAETKAAFEKISETLAGRI